MDMTQAGIFNWTSSELDTYILYILINYIFRGILDNQRIENGIGLQQISTKKTSRKMIRLESGQWGHPALNCMHSNACCDCYPGST